MADREFRAAAALGHTFHNFLKRLNRLRECDAWVRFLRDATASQGFTEQAADYEREHALTQYAQGDPRSAVEQLEALVERLRRTTEFDPAFQLALATRDWGKMLDEAGASIQAVPILQEAVGRWEKLVAESSGALLESPARCRTLRQCQGRTWQSFNGYELSRICIHGRWMARRGPGHRGSCT